MGGVRDDLTIHEKALDVVIELLKKEQVSVFLFITTNLVYLSTFPSLTAG